MPQVDDGEETRRAALGLFRRAAPLQAQARALRPGEGLSTLVWGGEIEEMARRAEGVEPERASGSFRELRHRALELEVWSQQYLDAGVEFPDGHSALSAFVAAFMAVRAELRGARFYLALELKVLDAETLRGFCAHLGARPSSLLEAVRAAAITNSLNPEPKEYGLELLEAKAAPRADDLVAVSVEGRVLAPESLLDFAHRRYVACWADEHWEPESLAEAAYEALYASNGNPSPDEWGVETHSSRFEVLEPREAWGAAQP